MGIVNVTPDSFSDGGRFATTDTAIAHGRELIAQGADILDIGGESTRPGATRPLVSEELDRVVPVISALAAEGAAVSVDTMRAEVAEAAALAGAVVINDVSGGLADPDILRVAADHDVLYVAMHWRAHSTEMQQHAVYDGPGGVVGAVRDELSARIDDALAAGVDLERLVVDPGLGFAKSPDHNWELLKHLDELVGLGRPRPVAEREHANVALTTIVSLQGMWGVRVHDVRASADAIRVVERFAHDPGEA
ncbi:dihydropteroate synthase [Nocardioides sp. Soil796]|nr:dihydropteroate synthase [Nocardioides sp. Soil796]